jgi:hypothetical protein
MASNWAGGGRSAFKGAGQVRWFNPQPIQKKNRRKTSQKPKPVFENAFRGKSHLTLVLPSKSLLKSAPFARGPVRRPSSKVMCTLVTGMLASPCFF